jgi:hypothetical protein
MLLSQKLVCVCRSVAALSVLPLAGSSHGRRVPCARAGAAAATAWAAHTGRLKDQASMRQLSEAARSLLARPLAGGCRTSGPKLGCWAPAPRLLLLLLLVDVMLLHCLDR